MVKLNTNGLNLYFPGIKDKYAEHRYNETTGNLARIFMEVVSLRDWRSFEERQHMQVTADLMLHLNTTLNDTGVEVKAAQMMLKDLQVNFTMIIEGMTLKFHITEMKVGSMPVYYSSFGPINEVMFKEAFNTLCDPLALVLPLLNESIEAVAIKLPSLIVDLF